jgi:hypothetical protein
MTGPQRTAVSFGHERVGRLCPRRPISRCSRFLGPSYGVLDVDVRDRAAVGVGVDQQDLAAARGRLEGQVDGHGGAAGCALGTQTATRSRRGPPPGAVGATSTADEGSSSASGSAASAVQARSTSASGGSASKAGCWRPSWRSRRSLSSSRAGTTPTTASPAAASLASASRSSQRVPAATTASAWQLFRMRVGIASPLGWRRCGLSDQLLDRPRQLSHQGVVGLDLGRGALGARGRSCAPHRSPPRPAPVIA